MTNYTSDLKTWGSTGVTYPDNYAYKAGEQPPDAWDNFTNYNLIKDVTDHLIPLTNNRLDSSSKTSYPENPTDREQLWKTDNSELHIYDDDDSKWRQVLFSDGSTKREGTQDYDGNDLINLSHLDTRSASFNTDGEGKLEIYGKSNYYGKNRDARIFELVDEIIQTDGNADGGFVFSGLTKVDEVRKEILSVRPQLDDARNLHYLGKPIWHGGNFHPSNYYTKNQIGNLFVNESGDTMTGDLHMDNSHIFGQTVIYTGVDAPNNVRFRDVDGFKNERDNFLAKGPRPNMVLDDTSTNSGYGQQWEITAHDSSLYIQLLNTLFGIELDGDDLSIKAFNKNTGAEQVIADL